MESKIKKDPEYKNRVLSVCDLGISALDAISQPFSEKEDVNGNIREWFLYEDQTIGLPEIASMISKGVKPKQIKDSFSKAQKYYYGDDKWEKYPLSKHFIFIATEGGDKNIYIDKCYELYKNPEKIHDYINSNKTVDDYKKAFKY